jgi:hypothetical protein
VAVKRALGPWDGVFIAGLALACWVAPGPVYLLALGAFGLPHVLWELGWIRQATRGWLGRGWWLTLGAILALQAIARLGSWAGWLDSSLALGMDLLTLGLALGLVATVRSPVAREGANGGMGELLTRGLAGLVAVALVGAGIAGDVASMLWVLVVLAMAHNFTPLALVRLAPQRDRRAERWLLLAFALPLVMLAMPLAGVRPAMAQPQAWWPVEALWVQSLWPGSVQAVFSALVLAQCLHYHAVLRVMPRLGPVWTAPGWRTLAILASALMAAAFALDFTGTRPLYAVAAGLHAWLEWPVLLCALTRATAAT